MDFNIKRDSWFIKGICLHISVSFFIASFAATIYLDLWGHVWKDLFHILVTPAPLITDYFQVGNLASAFLNAGLCGTSCWALMTFLNAECRPSMLAGYFLVVAHCFYGLNFFNMWPPILGILLFTKVFKVGFRYNLDMAMFSTAFGPFISEMLFRYHVWNYYIAEQVQISVLGFIYVIIFSIFLGFAIPAMLPGALKLHKGFNLYNGGLAFGLLGLFIYAFMYKTLGIDSPRSYQLPNTLYEAHGNTYPTFIICYFAIMFLFCLIWGWFLNGRSFKGYRELLKSNSHSADFFVEYGRGNVLINMGVYGFMVLAYFILVITFTDGAGFTGPTVGVIIAAMTFSSQGQHPVNVWPIFLGYGILSIFVTILCVISGMEIPWTLSTQGYLNGAAFATGLCPIAGRYGKRFGVIAGFMAAVICTSTSAMHGGLMLYNGGLTTGITALILVPCLEYYWHEKKRA
ncbi:MAG: DUF1576 domain-containing protein [Lachnospiraceae bacterium]|nr:DUF1576 domain-containing protein [Lachnospiraceae bacterium]